MIWFGVVYVISVIGGMYFSNKLFNKNYFFLPYCLLPIFNTIFLFVLIIIYSMYKNHMLNNYFK